MTGKKPLGPFDPTFADGAAYEVADKGEALRSRILSLASQWDCDPKAGADPKRKVVPWLEGVSDCWRAATDFRAVVLDLFCRVPAGYQATALDLTRRIVRWAEDGLSFFVDVQGADETLTDWGDDDDGDIPEVVRGTGPDVIPKKFCMLEPPSPLRVSRWARKGGALLHRLQFLEQTLYSHPAAGTDLLTGSRTLDLLLDFKHALDCAAEEFRLEASEFEGVVDRGPSGNAEGDDELPEQEPPTQVGVPGCGAQIMSDVTDSPHPRPNPWWSSWDWECIPRDVISDLDGFIHAGTLDSLFLFNMEEIGMKLAKRNADLSRYGFGEPIPGTWWMPDWGSQTEPERRPASTVTIRLKANHAPPWHSKSVDLDFNVLIPGPPNPATKLPDLCRTIATHFDTWSAAVGARLETEAKRQGWTAAGPIPPHWTLSRLPNEAGKRLRGRVQTPRVPRDRLDEFVGEVLATDRKRRCRTTIATLEKKTGWSVGTIQALPTWQAEQRIREMERSGGGRRPVSLTSKLLNVLKDGSAQEALEELIEREEDGSEDRANGPSKSQRSSRE